MDEAAKGKLLPVPRWQPICDEASKQNPLSGLSPAPRQGSESRENDQTNRRRLWDDGEAGHRQAVGRGKSIECRDVGLRDASCCAAVALAEVVRQGAEVGAVDCGGEQEVALVPVGVTLAEVRGKDAEVSTIDCAVEVGVAQ